MSLKLKVLGLGLLAMMATSAFAVMNASAKDQPTTHFVADPPTHLLKVKGTDGFGTQHALGFKEVGAEIGISCTHSTYHGEVTGTAATTTGAVLVRPHYTNCATENGTWGSVVVHVPTTCGTKVFEFTSGKPGTVHVKCAITITHPNCEITVPVQTPHSGGVTYNTVTESNKHALTLGVNVGGITGQYHGGICVFLGTSHTFNMTGSATVWGEDKDNLRVNVTHT